MDLKIAQRVSHTHVNGTSDGVCEREDGKKVRKKEGREKEGGKTEKED